MTALFSISTDWPLLWKRAFPSVSVALRCSEQWRQSAPHLTPLGEKNKKHMAVNSCIITKQQKSCSLVWFCCSRRRSFLQVGTDLGAAGRGQWDRRADPTPPASAAWSSESPARWTPWTSGNCRTCSQIWWKPPPDFHPAGSPGCRTPEGGGGGEKAKEMSPTMD